MELTRANELKDLTIEIREMVRRSTILKYKVLNDMCEGVFKFDGGCSKKNTYDTATSYLDGKKIKYWIYFGCMNQMVVIKRLN